MVGRKIACYRRKRKLTQKELAAMVGITKGHLASIEQGRKTPHITTLVLIAECLMVDVSKLISRK